MSAAFQLELIGARLLGPQPITDVWWPFEQSAVHALYGKNGAGKTRMTYALADLFAGEPSPHDSYLVAKVVETATSHDTTAGSFILHNLPQFDELRNPAMADDPIDIPWSADEYSAWERELGDQLWARWRGADLEWADEAWHDLTSAEDGWNDDLERLESDLAKLREEFERGDATSAEEDVDSFDAVIRLEDEIRNHQVSKPVEQEYRRNLEFGACVISDIVTSGLVALTPIKTGWELAPAIIRDPVRRHLAAEIDMVSDLASSLKSVRSQGETLKALQIQGFHMHTHVLMPLSRLGNRSRLSSEANLLSRSDLIPYRLGHGDAFEALEWIPIPVSAGAGSVVIRDDQLDIDVVTEWTRQLLADEAAESGHPIVKGANAIQDRARADVRELGSSASHVGSLFLADAPPVRVSIRDPEDWFTGEPLGWVTDEPDRQALGLEALSEAQRRWAVLSIALVVTLRAAFVARTRQGVTTVSISASGMHGAPATSARNATRSSINRLPLTRPLIVIVLDEPDGALHATAQRYAIEGLCEFVRELGATVVLSTHSRDFLNHPEVMAHHVSRVAGGEVRVAPLRAPHRKMCESLGISPADLFLLCRGILVVEGAHDEAVIDAVIGRELSDLGIRVVPMRGGRNLATVVDSTFLADLTDVPVIAVLDNLSAEKVQAYWSELVMSDADKFDEITERHLPGPRGGEESFLRNYCREAAKRGQTRRFRVVGLSKPDIPEYLPVERVLGDRSSSSWEALRAEHSQQKKNRNFKSWLTQRYNVTITAESLREAAAQLDEVHPDFVHLLDVCSQATRRHSIQSADDGSSGRAPF